jgi:hypothetical protein
VCCFERVSPLPVQFEREMFSVAAERFLLWIEESVVIFTLQSFTEYHKVLKRLVMVDIKRLCCGHRRLNVGITAVATVVTVVTSRVAGVRWWICSRGLLRHVADGCFFVLCVDETKNKKTSSKHTRFCVVVGAGGWRTEGSRKQGLPFLSDDRMPHLIITDPLMMGDLSGHEPKISLEIKKTDPLWTCS